MISLKQYPECQCKIHVDVLKSKQNFKLCFLKYINIHLILFKTLALYKLFTYLLTYLLTIRQSVFSFTLILTGSTGNSMN